jgi:hypothetical protein
MADMILEISDRVGFASASGSFVDCSPKTCISSFGSVGLLNRFGIIQASHGSGWRSRTEKVKVDHYPASPALDFGDPMVVDAGHVPTGLPKSVAAEIPDTPAGNRVRKGFQAIMAHDWNVAQAWFRDALNHDPGNAGIQRLIELADYTMERERHPSASTPPRTVPPDERAPDKAAMAALGTNLDNRMDAGLANAFDDFNRNYLPKHPGLMNPTPEKGGSLSKPEPEADSARWKKFFGTLFVAPLGTNSAGAVRN